MPERENVPRVVYVDHARCVETAIKEDVPEIHTVLDRTDHAAGENPYYRG